MLLLHDTELSRHLERRLGLGPDLLHSYALRVFYQRQPRTAHPVHGKYGELGDDEGDHALAGERQGTLCADLGLAVLGGVGDGRNDLKYRTATLSNHF